MLVISEIIPIILLFYGLFIGYKWQDKEISDIIEQEEEKFTETSIRLERLVPNHLKPDESFTSIESKLHSPPKLLFTPQNKVVLQQWSSQ